MTRIWITRARPGAQATARRVRARGFEPLVAPVLEVRRLAVKIDLKGVAALAFTSANGVRAFAALCGGRDRLAFTVGKATARAARAAGFADILSADGDVDGLARMIAARASELDGVVLHPGAARAAGDLTGDLTGSGVRARAVSVYETVAAKVPARVLGQLAAIDGVLAHSPRAGRRLAEILHGTSAPNLAAYCLSREVAAALEGLDIGPIVAAPLPNEDALLSLIVG